MLLSSRSKAPAQVSNQDRIILVMGPTGVGKSSFIQAATGEGDHTIGHGIVSHTSEIRSVRTTHPVNQYPVVFVDTPGFDVPYKSDMEILSMISDWLVHNYPRGMNLAGIVYLHRISDNRVARASLKSLLTFPSICGLDSMPTVVLVTTMWDGIREETGGRRETELKETFWRDMIADGCKTERFYRTYESAWDILNNLFNVVDLPAVPPPATYPPLRRDEHNPPDSSIPQHIRYMRHHVTGVARFFREGSTAMQSTRRVWSKSTLLVLVLVVLLLTVVGVVGTMLALRTLKRPDSGA